MAVFQNFVLIAALIAWAIAQTLKIPIEYLQTHKWNWALLWQAGGMPSSHSALVVAAAHGIGLSVGFDSALFALAFVICMVVVYDATGIRRQAGIHAELINAMISDLAARKPADSSGKQKQLAEVLGHTPAEALGGIGLGLLVAQLTWLVWVK
jgi:acid phosphatase family membrane protein YuiD